MRRLLRIAIALALLVLLYVGITFVQVWSASRADYRGTADALVVLGAAQYDGRPSPVLEARLEHALELYSEGVADKIVTTGSNQEGDRFTQGFAGYDYLRDRGVPDADIVVIVDGSNTWEELSAAANQLRPLGLTNVVLVSDPYHSLRADRIADEVGLDANVSPTNSSSATSQLVRETVGVAVGRIIGFRRLSNWAS
ncbi:MAG: YdcF family protein [Acidimicrobiales bacterium]